MGASAKESALAVHAHLQGLWELLEVPKKLSAFGIGADRRAHVLEIMKTQQPGFDQNPVPFKVAEHLAPFLDPFLK